MSSMSSFSPYSGIASSQYLELEDNSQDNLDNIKQTCPFNQSQSHANIYHPLHNPKAADFEASEENQLALWISKSNNRQFSKSHGQSLPQSKLHPLFCFCREAFALLVLCCCCGVILVSTYLLPFYMPLPAASYAVLPLATKHLPLCCIAVRGSQLDSSTFQSFFPAPCGSSDSLASGWPVFPGYVPPSPFPLFMVCCPLVAQRVEVGSAAPGPIVVRRLRWTKLLSVSCVAPPVTQ
jgi:hypothetical protein